MGTLQNPFTIGIQLTSQFYSGQSFVNFWYKYSGICDIGVSVNMLATIIRNFERKLLDLRAAKRRSKSEIL